MRLDTGYWKKLSANCPDVKKFIMLLRANFLSWIKKSIIPDVITYAGNGEPTLHPDFPGIIDDSIILRDKYFKKTELLFCQMQQQSQIH